VNRALGLYLRLISLQIRSQMQYRLAFVLEASASAASNALTFITLILVLERFGTVGGWKLPEIAFLFGIVELSFGWMDMVFSGFDPDSFSVYIRLGGLDQLLLRPVSLTLQVLGSRFLLRRLGRVFQGFLIFLFALSLNSIEWNVVKIAYLPVVIASLVAYFGGLFVIGSSLTFWTGEAIEAVNIFTYGGSEMISYPMHIYPDWIRKFFTYILPAIFLNYYPALYLLDKPDPFHMPAFTPLLTPVVGFGLLAIGLLFWRFGLRHYQSTGT